MAIVASLLGYVNPDHFDVDDIPVITGEIWDRRTDEPHFKPLADLLAASDAAAIDGEFMSFDEWLDHHATFEPEPSYWQEEYVR